jgi:hypothetical protein
MTTRKQKTAFDWEAERNAQEVAGALADALVARLGLSAPIDPLAVAATERRFLRAGGADLGARYDGKLKYAREKNRFLLFYNTRYDGGLPAGAHHPRTRFSIAHELGHYFIDHHHRYLRGGGPPHASSSEFISDNPWEREADAFAASLLLPTHLAAPVLAGGELTLGLIDRAVARFDTSFVGTAIRGVRLSDLPCAVAGVRDGRVAWMFPSEALIRAGCYPGKRDVESPVARARWDAFAAGDNGRACEDGLLRHWFQTYDREDELYDVYLTEQFLPVRVMGTLLVVLTMDEEDLGGEEHEEEEEEDRDRFGRSRA